MRRDTEALRDVHCDDELRRESSVRAETASVVVASTEPKAAPQHSRNTLSAFERSRSPSLAPKARCGVLRSSREKPALRAFRHGPY
jgi:hypothetical protein